MHLLRLNTRRNRPARPNLVVLLVLMLACAALPAYAQAPLQEPGHTTFRPFNEALYEKEILSTLRVHVRNEGGKQVYSDAVKRAKKKEEDKPLPLPWRSSLLALSSTIAANLTFSPVEDKKGELKPFSVYVKLTEDDAMVRSSRPRYSNHVGGISFEYPGKGVKSIFLDGMERTGIYVVVPRVASIPGTAVMICPKEISGQLLKESPYQVTNVEFLPEAFASGGFQGETPKDSARAAILTSPDMPACSRFEDVHTAFVPIVKAFCDPNTLKPDNRQKVDKPISSVQGGVMSTTELRAPWGTRVAKHSTTMIVKKVFVDFSTWATVQKTEVRVDRGTCYVVARESDSSDRT